MLVLQFFGMVVGKTNAPHPPRWYPLTEYLVSDLLYGLSLIPILVVFRRGGTLAKSVAVLFCLTLSVHIVRSVHANGPKFLLEVFDS